MNINWKKVWFKPWIGKNYQNGLNGKKILILGDSAYCGDEDCKDSCGYKSQNLEQFQKTECSKFNEWIISNFLDYCDGKQGSSPNNTFTKFTKVLAGDADFVWEKYKDLWNSVAFYNFVQTASDESANKSYTQEDFDNSIEPFNEVVEELSPDIVICWGDDVWNNANLYGYDWKDLSDDNIEGYYGVYSKNENKILFVHMYHPSAPNLSYEEWIPKMKKMLAVKV